MFYPPNKEQLPNFELEEKYFFDSEENRCYNAFVMKSFLDEESAERYVRWKRPVYSKGTFKFVQKTLVEEISISITDEEDDEASNEVRNSIKFDLA